MNKLLMAVASKGEYICDIARALGHHLDDDGKPVDIMLEAQLRDALLQLQNIADILDEHYAFDDAD